MTHTPEQIAQAKQEALDTIRESIATYREALPNARSDCFVVYTGTLACPIFVNEEAVRAGRFCISLMHATVFETEFVAKRFASRVMNGAGERGNVIDQRSAFEREIKNREHLLATLFKAA